MWKLTTDSPASSYGIPVLEIYDRQTGLVQIYGPCDFLEVEPGRVEAAADMVRPMLGWEGLGPDRKQALLAFCSVPV